jgi:2-polyprenyl-3-methyl-5-hydroxy-6-metoxy-1,4-benzoquinol methylase
MMLVRSRPGLGIPNYFAMRIQNTEAYFDALAAHWDGRLRRSSLFQARYREFENLIQRYATPRSRSLDYGCGSGTLCEVLTRYSAEVVGTDISQEMRALAEKRLVDHPSARILELAEVDRFGFDLVLCSSVIEYAEKDSEFLHNLITYLAPGGHLVISFPNRMGCLQLLQRHVLSRFDADSYVHLQRNTYTRRSIRRLLAAAGLELLHLDAPIGLPGLTALGLGELLFCVARKPAV